MPKYFLGKTLLVFTAHPDDEQLAAGTMYENYKAGGRTILICATSGEKGKSHLTRPATDAELKKIRKDELLQAGKILGISDIIFLGLPDAKVKENEKKLIEKSAPLFAKIKPDQILSFGPDGISAHWDHITVGKVARKLAKRFKVPLAAFTFHPEIARRRHKMLLARRKFGNYADLIEHRKGDIRIPIDPWRKRKAMNVHKSQFIDGGWIKTLPRAVAERFFSSEHFVTEKV